MTSGNQKLNFKHKNVIMLRKSKYAISIDSNYSKNDEKSSIRSFELL